MSSDGPSEQSAPNQLDPPEAHTESKTPKEHTNVEDAIEPATSTPPVESQEPTETAENPVPNVKDHTSSAAEAQESETFCIFCNISGHISETCTMFRTAVERRAIFRSKNLCTRCLDPIFDSTLTEHEICEKPIEICIVCSGFHHRLMLCEPKKNCVFLNDDVVRFYCRLCENSGHRTRSCPNYVVGLTVAERRGRLQREKRCLLCFKHEHDLDTCSYANRLCKTCSKTYNDQKRAAHHNLLCFNIEKDLQKLAKRNADECYLCHQPGHVFEECPEYIIGTSAADRKSRIEQEDRCLICMVSNSKPDWKHDSCRKLQKYCKLCMKIYDDPEKAAHHSILCLETNEDTETSKKSCFMCEDADHLFNKCPTYVSGTNAAQRIAKMKQEDRCLYCFLPNTNGSHEICREPEKLCKLCMKIYKDPAKSVHHTLFCVHKETNRKNKKAAQRKKLRKQNRAAPYP